MRRGLSVSLSPSDDVVLRGVDALKSREARFRTMENWIISPDFVQRLVTNSTAW